MLGEQISDPLGVDGDISEAQGLGLLNVNTTMSAAKHVSPISASCPHSESILQAYEFTVENQSELIPSDRCLFQKV